MGIQDPIVHLDYSPYGAFDNNHALSAYSSGADNQTDMWGRCKIIFVKTKMGITVFYQQLRRKFILLQQ